MELNLICGIYDWISEGTNFKDYVWTLFTALIGVGAAYLIFRIKENITENEKLKENDQVIDIIKFSIDNEIENLEKLIENLKSYLELEIDKVSQVSKMVYNASFIDSILRIDILTLSRVFELFSKKYNQQLSVVSFVTTLNVIRSYYNQLDKEQNNFDVKCEESFSDLNKNYIELLKSVNSELNLFGEKQHKIENLKFDFLIKIQERDYKNDKNPEKIIGNTSIHKEFARDLINTLNVDENKHSLNLDSYHYAKNVIFETSQLQQKIDHFSATTEKQIENLTIELESLRSYQIILKN